MNRVSILLYHKSLSLSLINESIHFIIDNVNVSFTVDNNEISMILTGRKKCENLDKIFFLIFDYLFLLLGSYPKIIERKYNDKAVSISDLANKFLTSDNYYKNNMNLVAINSTILNKDCLNSFKNLNGDIISLLGYITSDVYKNVLFYHKILMLLQLVDGVYFSDKKLSDELRKTLGLKKKDRLYFRHKVQNLMEKFFRVHKSYNLGLMRHLRVTKRKYIDVLVDTRDAHSHIMNKEFQMSNTIEMYMHFEILYLAIRIFLIERYLISTSKHRIHFDKNGLEYYTTCFNQWVENTIR